VADVIDQFISKLNENGVKDFSSDIVRKMYFRGRILNDEAVLSSLELMSGDELVLT
jgi:hypothetical protein